MLPWNTGGSIMWRWRRRREDPNIGWVSSTREARAGARLADEVEAFLSGMSGRWFLARRRDVPTWSYVNRVAHAPPDALRQLATWAPAGAFNDVSWRETIGLLAEEILEAAKGDPASIRRIQLDRLIPLELQIMSSGARIVAPCELLALGRACLHDHPSYGPPGDSG
jgi:hypothetical protein